MRPADIVELLKTLAVDVREYVAQALEPVVAKQAELEQRVAALPTEAIKGDQGERGANAYEIACSVGYRGSMEEWVEALHGKDGSQGERGEDGKSVSVLDVLPAMREEVARLVAEIPAPQDGKSVTLDDIGPLIEQHVKDIPALGPDAVDEQLAKSIASFVEHLAQRFNEEAACG